MNLVLAERRERLRDDKSFRFANGQEPTTDDG
jgi:hypothetical protein